MSLKVENQINELIEQKSRILLCLPKNPSTDAITAGLALLMYLEKKGKQAKIVAADFSLPASHAFLPKSQEIFGEIPALKKFIISLDVSKTQVEEINYDLHDNKLNVYVTPRNGYFSEHDLKTSAGDFTYDLIITIDAHDLNSLGSVYQNNIDFFYHLPIINIDHNPANDNYGQINLVEVKSTSVSEIIFEMIQQFAPHFLDEYIATNLLTGIISKTKSFKTSSVTPRSLAIASHLIANGARREEIVKNLYQTKSIHTLKLWGKALIKLQKDQNYQIVWSVLETQDFIESGATEDELEKVVDELIVNTPEAKNIFILYAKPGIGCRAILSTPHYIKAKDLFKEYNPKGTQDFTYLEFKNLSTLEAEKVILDKLKKAI
jgi:nanoRNase/pAp phosphatase (c-di-AMP/oligoRNAs hydrolase)